MVNRVLLRRCQQGDSVHRAVEYAAKVLERRGLTGFDAHDARSRDNAVSVTLRLSFKQLDDHELERFHELAIFPEDATIPFGNGGPALGSDRGTGRLRYRGTVPAFVRVVAVVHVRSGDPYCLFA
jgi:hypothetical protein